MVEKEVCRADGLVHYAGPDCDRILGRDLCK